MRACKRKQRRIWGLVLGGAGLVLLLLCLPGWGLLCLLGIVLMAAAVLLWKRN